MKQHIQTTLFGLAISVILGCGIVNADTQTPKISDIEYQRYEWTNDNDFEGHAYHRFLATQLPKGLYYFTRMVATANINDTPEKETIVLITIDKKVSSYPYDSDCVQAFLLITETGSQVGAPTKKHVFKLFDAGTHALDVPTKASIELQSPSFVFTQPPKDAFKSRDSVFRLVDLTGDGILDVWVEFGYAVVVISFQNGEFEGTFSSYTVPGPLPDPEYIDLDNDGRYEIKIPYSIQIEGVPGAPYLPWMSLYEWNGNAYVLNNERFYAGNDDFLIRLLSEYNYQMLRRGTFTKQCQIYSFYLGLVYYYRGSTMGARAVLKLVVERGGQNDYVQAAESILKKLPPPPR
ncbi:MAG: VCBS repeat-containing protein [Candidatus Poribacteria bacterium]|nr:VCBS repeat-containing protein [Candidatus Poribacteria bacterium]